MCFTIPRLTIRGIRFQLCQKLLKASGGIVRQKCQDREEDKRVGFYRIPRLRTMDGDGWVRLLNYSFGEIIHSNNFYKSMNFFRFDIKSPLIYRIVRHFCKGFTSKFRDQYVPVSITSSILVDTNSSFRYLRWFCFVIVAISIWLFASASIFCVNTLKTSWQCHIFILNSPLVISGSLNVVPHQRRK